MPRKLSYTEDTFHKTEYTYQCEVYRFTHRRHIQYYETGGTTRPKKPPA